MLKLEIPKSIFARMLEQIQAEAPIEACGILAGSEGRVEKLYKMTNTEARCDHYMMEPAEQFAAMKDMRTAGLEMLAIYHSHPATPARASAEDIRLAFTSDIAYVIISLEDPDGPVVKSFTVEDGKANEVAVDIVDD